MKKLDQNIHEVHAIFKRVGMSIDFPLDYKTFFHNFSSHSGDYLSLAFESASHEISQEEITSTNSLKEWRKFYEISSSSHRPHILIGLGWTVAKTKNTEILQQFSECERWFISDGAGYFDALFRPRKTLIEKSVPAYVQLEVKGYNKGIGRFLFYKYAGNYSNIDGQISILDKEYEENFWCGVGSAAGYVGGTQISQLVEMNKKCTSSFLLGFAIGKTNRYQVGQLRDFDLEEWYSLNLGSIEKQNELLDHFFDDQIGHSNTSFYKALDDLKIEVRNVAQSTSLANDKK